jgi:acyl-CoA synthetase (AMP-forming)/AMP-acid ligase II
LQASAILTVETEGFEEKIICAAYVPAAGSVLTSKELSTELARRLPHYVMPARWQELEALPLASNGKIDKRKIKEMFLARDPAREHSRTRSSMSEK